MAPLLRRPPSDPLAPRPVATERALDRAEVVRKVVLSEEVDQQRAAHVLHAETHRCQRNRVHPHPDRGLLGAVDGDLGYALDLRKALHDHRVGGVIEIARGDGLGDCRFTSRPEPTVVAVATVGTVQKLIAAI